MDPSTVLTVDALGRMERDMAEGRLDPEEVLLSEARYLAESEQEGAADRATLLAAIAVELRRKRVLRGIASEIAGVLELLLDNPRDWSMGAHGPYLQALPVFAGRGLGDEHKASARDVQRLFTERNSIAHKGKAVAQSDGKSHVKVALEAFRILREVLEAHSAE